jgi:uncharacterized protein involved in exopolysaccharide biosynthesis
MTDSNIDPSAHEEAEISLLDLLQVVADNLRLLVGGSLLAGVLVLGWAFTLPPTFTASTTFMPPQQQASGAASLLQSLGSLGGLAGAASGLKNPIDQYVAFVKSRSVQDALIDRFDLTERYKQKYRQSTAKTLDGRARVKSGKDGLITVEVDDRDPEFAAKLANAHVEELGKLLGRLAVTEAQQRRLFFEKQLSATKEKLVKAELALRSTGVNASVLKSSPVAAVEGVAKLKAAIAAQEIKLASMRGYLAESAFEFKQAQSELGAMRAQMAKLEVGEPALSANAAGGDYITKYREFKYFETLFELFSKQYEIARVDESREGAVIQVLDVAVPPELKSKPQKGLIAMLATLATGFVLLLFVFVRQALRSSNADPGTAQKVQRLRNALRRAVGLRSPL